MFLSDAAKRRLYDFELITLRIPHGLRSIEPSEPNLAKPTKLFISPLDC